MEAIKNIGDTFGFVRKELIKGNKKSLGINDAKALFDRISCFMLFSCEKILP